MKMVIMLVIQFLFLSFLFSCSTAQKTERPPLLDLSAEITQVNPVERSYQSITFELTMQVSNPNAAAVDIQDMQYGIFLKDSSSKSMSKHESPFSLPPNGSNEIKLSQKVMLGDNPDQIIAFLQKNSAFFDMEVIIPFESDGQQKTTRISREDEIALPALPEVKVNLAQAAKVPNKSIDASFEVILQNPNDFDIHIDKFTYELLLEDKKFEEGMVALDQVIFQGTSWMFEENIKLDAALLKEDFKSWMKKSQIKYQLKGTMVISKVGSVPVELSDTIQIN